jgi:sugar/nucleoside kinase (ribokinase family)
MHDVAGVGASSVDLVYRLPSFPAAGGAHSKLPIETHAISCGGQTATAMAGCATLGLRAAFLGATGNDAHGARVRAALTARGVDISEATLADGPQPYAVILVAGGDRIVLWHRDESANVSPSRITRASSTVLGARLLHLDDVDIDASLAAAGIARQAGRFVTTDIDRVTTGTTELIHLATHVIVAEHVPELLTGERDLVRALRMLRELNAGPIIVTRGAAGAIALDGDTVIEVPGVGVDAVDTTGAGDIFRAGFIASLLAGRALRDSIRFANAAAAVSCTRHGAIDAVPTGEEVREVLSARC